MRLTLLPPLTQTTGSDAVRRDIGAAVVRSQSAGGVVLEFGPADGPPHLRLGLSGHEATKLSAILQSIAANGGESILLADQ
jgi:hypothetical protein